MYCLLCRMLRAGLALRVDGHRGSGTRRHLYAMLLTAEIISDIPVVGAGLAGYIFTALHVPGLRLLLSTTDLGAYCAPCNGATDSGDVVTASAADLVTKNAANDRADNRPGNVDLVLCLGNLFLCDPAALLGSSGYRAG